MRFYFAARPSPSNPRSAPSPPFMNRRDFFRSSATTSTSLLLLGSGGTSAAGATLVGPHKATLLDGPEHVPESSRPLHDLAPAKWIWFPCGRCLANTFVL